MQQGMIFILIPRIALYVTEVCTKTEYVQRDPKFPYNDRARIFLSTDFDIRILILYEK